MKDTIQSTAALDFSERIERFRLTKTGRMIAAYFLNNKATVAFQSLSSIASELGISDISIVRFARSIGYEGFTDLKQHIQAELSSMLDANHSEVNTLALFTAKMRAASQLPSDMLNADRYSGIIYDTLSANPEDKFEKAADLMISSSSIYIFGSNSRQAAVESLYTILIPFMPNVKKISNNFYEMAVSMQDIKENDCIILYSFGRQARLESDILDCVKRTNCRLIVITELPESDISKAAGCVLYSKANLGLPFYSNVGSNVIAEKLVYLIVLKTWETSRKRLSYIDVRIAAASGSSR